MNRRSALVTGANKGIGFFVASNLAEHGYNLILACRNLTRGLVAVQKIQKEFPNLTVEFIEMDVSNETSIATAAQKVKSSHPEGITALVNNAGVWNKTDPIPDQAQSCVTTNYFGTLLVCQYFFPLLPRDGTARVVNLSSLLGEYPHSAPTPSTLETLRDPNLTLETLNGVMAAYRCRPEEGWNGTPYGVSKAGVGVATRLLSRSPGWDTVGVTCCHPGWCATDMGGWDQAPRTASQGARTPTWLVTAPRGEVVAGGYYVDPGVLGTPF